MKMKYFGLSETKLFHFSRIFKNRGGGGPPLRFGVNERQMVILTCLAFLFDTTPLLEISTFLVWNLAIKLDLIALCLYAISYVSGLNFK